MEKNLSVWQLGGFTFAVVLGTLLHFLYDWTNAYIVTPVSAVNESTWEHMKIFFFPALLFAGIQGLCCKDEYAGFWWIKTIGILVGVLSIPILFYTINSAFGKTPDWLNVLLFFVSAGFSYLVEYWLFKRDFSLPFSWLALVILAGVSGLFFLFTYYPPKIPLFEDPITRTYGLFASKK